MADFTKLLTCLVNTQARAARSEQPERELEQLLQDVLRCTGLPYGFIGIFENPQRGGRRFQLLGLKGSAWNTATKAFFDKNALEVEALRTGSGLLSLVVQHNDAVITASPEIPGLHTDATLPNILVGLPFVSRGALRGVIGFAAIHHGPPAELLTHLSPLARGIGLMCDASARLGAAPKALEEALSRSDAIIKTMPDAVISISINGFIRSLNPATEKIFGYPASEILNQHISMLQPAPEDTSTPLEALSTGDVKFLGTEHAITGRRRDGSLFPMEVTIAKGRFEGNPIFIWLVRDVTELRRAVHERQEFFDLTPEMVSITNDEGYFLRLNPNWERVLGYTQRELKERPLLDFVHPDDRNDTQAHLFELTGSHLSAVHSTAQFENRFRARDGSYRWLQWVARRHPTEPRVYAAARDTTERRALFEQRQALVDILEASPDLVAMMSATGELFFLNTAGRHMLGLGDVALPSLTITDLLPPQAARTAVEDAIPSALEDGIWTGESLIRVGDGSDIPTSQILIAHTNPQDGAFSHLSLVAHDIRALKEVDRLKDEFISSVSHELRTPLTSLRGALGLIVGGVMGTLPEKAVGLLQIAQNNTERLIRLINDILDLEKIEAGRMEFVSTCFEINVIVETTLRDLAAMASEAGVTLNARVEPGLQIDGDSDRLTQALTNLVGNAIKFSPRGEEVRVEVSRLGTHRARVTVSDNGPGIPKEHVHRIFDKFQQLDATDTRKKGGTGLGLVLSNAIVRGHDGVIGVESVPGEGSRFYFELPASSWSPPNYTTTHNAQVLVVEDDEQTRFVITTQLQQAGLTCIEARDGVEALAIATSHTPDLIVLDIGIPTIDGFALVSKLRENALANMPLLVYTGRSLSAEERRRLTLGTTRHLTKALVGRNRFLEEVLFLLEGSSSQR